ncbi:lytic transglycosylase domain-containing protein [Pigmentiphaga soli]|uniref:Lytic transglycosylase domain-containing protein n=1 Tax=Pigmentiphaga soli TaxID=1007095 RepID=A0ABP8GSW0_9BURK
MVDAQSRSPLKQMTVRIRKGFADASRSYTLYLGLAMLVLFGALQLSPELRAQARLLYVDMEAGSSDAPAAAPVAEAEPAPVAAVPAVPAAAVASADAVVAPVVRNRSVAFLESVGDGRSAAKLPVAKASPAQLESLGRYIARKYRVSNEATRMLVSTAYGVGQEMGIDPLLLLAVMAIESSFNPFAESQVGAQGLMQVLTKVHVDKFQSFGGEQAAWNPVANIHVGALILKDCIVRGGSLVAGLRMYVGTTPTGDSPYGDKVLAERRRLASAAGMPADKPVAEPQQAATAELIPPAPAPRAAAASATVM